MVGLLVTSSFYVLGLFKFTIGFMSFLGYSKSNALLKEIAI
jgi:hypothetical protein